MPLNTSPVRVQTKIPDLKLVGKELQRRFRQSMKEAHLEATSKAKDILKSSITLAGSVATGKLLNSVSAHLVKDNSITGFTSEVGFKKPGSAYAYFSNYGRGSSALLPPRNVMLQWARAKGIEPQAVYLISRKIAEEGIEGKHFMEDARPKIEKSTDNIVRRKIREFSKGLK